LGLACPENEVSHSTLIVQKAVPEKKRKVLIITSEGGGGHTAVARALQSYLPHDQYSFVVVDMMKDCLKRLDPVQLFTLGRYTGNDFYNYCLRKKWNYALNFTFKMGRWFFYVAKYGHVRAIRGLLQCHKPDILISVVPLINGAVYKAAQEANIPCLVIPTDLDMGIHFTIGVNNPEGKKFKFTIPFDAPLVKETIKSAKIDDAPIVGFPVNTSFLASASEEDKEKIRNDFLLPDNKPIVMVLMGTVGIIELERIAQEMAFLDVPAHFTFCIGKGAFLKEKIMAITFPPHVTYTIVGFTDRIADLMEVSDLLVTKSGTVSVCEALYRNVPLLLDATSDVLLWERLNHDFVSYYGFGCSIKHPKQWTAAVSYLLKNPEKLKSYRNNIMKFPKPDPKAHIVALIEDLLA